MEPGEKDDEIDRLQPSEIVGFHASDFSRKLLGEKRPDRALSAGDFRAFFQKVGQTPYANQRSYSKIATTECRSVPRAGRSGSRPAPPGAGKGGTYGETNVSARSAEDQRRALAGAPGRGIDFAFARQVCRWCRTVSATGSGGPGGGRRQLLAGGQGRGRPDGAGPGRPNGHAGHRHQQPGPPGRAGAAGAARPGSHLHSHGPGGGDPFPAGG